MSVEVGPLSASLKRRLEEVLRVETDLERQLVDHEQALLHGDPAAIQALNLGLDALLVELRSSAEELRADTADLARALGLPTDSKLQDVIRSLPDAQLAAELRGVHTRLARTRRTTRSASSKNAAIARTSLDAIASVRGILGRMLGGGSGATEHNPLSRLDTKA